MENVINRHRSVTTLVVVLFVQIIGLAVQVRRPVEGKPVRLIRLWVATAVTPVEKLVIGAGNGVHRVWTGYFYLRGAREENENLKRQLEEARLQQLRVREDAGQAHRLQVLLGFKEQFISQTLAAQVVGTSGSQQSRIIYLDKGSGDGIKPDMAVVTPDGIVGKVTRVFPTTCQVLLISDQLSGVGAMLEKSRLQGIVTGTPTGGLSLQYVMSDEKVEKGEVVLASGGDRVYPKGMPIGRVKTVLPGANVFFNIELQPAADLNRLEEVLIITRLEDKTPAVDANAPPPRASDILAERLPSVPAPAPTDADGNPIKPPGSANSQPKAAAQGLTGSTPKIPADSGSGPATNPGAPKKTAPASGAGAQNPEKKKSAPAPQEKKPDATVPPQGAPEGER